MAIFTSAFVPLLTLFFLLRLFVLPVHLLWKVLIHSACGFICLWLVNTIAPYTGILIPINLVTVLVAGVLGLPGIGLLALAEACV